MGLQLNSGNINSYFNDAAIPHFLTSQLGQLRGDVLDIGCGKMRYKQTILGASGVKKYIGLDLEEGKFTYTVPADLYWDGVTMPLADNSIDSAILFEVLEHCDDPRIVVAEAFRVLKPSGTILFSTPFLYQLHGIPFDFQRPTPFGLKKLFSDAGFSVVHTQGSGSLDASLGQMMAMWIAHRPMSKWTRRILRRLFVPVFRTLLRWDRKRLDVSNWKENDMMPGILGWAKK